MISVIQPSRSRPGKAKATHDKWMSMAITQIDWQLSIDIDDPQQNEYTSWSKTTLISGNKSAVDAINRGAQTIIGEIVMVVSDDTDCFHGWDEAILKIVEGKKDWILKTQDGIQKWIITNPIMDRAYYNRFGYIYHPGYQHMFCDTELTCVADLTGRKLTSDLLFKHNHYSVTNEPKDAVSIKADSTWNLGEALFIKRAQQNFALKPEEIKGKITSVDYINWMRGKGIRV